MKNSTKKLIINADGFGFTQGNNDAIFEVAKAKTITSISVNTNFDYITDLPIFVQKFPTVSIGIHLNPVVGKPVLPPAKVSSLLGTNGEFWANEFVNKLHSGHINLHELEAEMLAQIKVVSKMGIAISHLDSHQNQHLRPKFFRVFLNIAEKTNIKKMRTHRHFICAERSNPKVSALKYYLTHPKTTSIHTYTRIQMYKAKSRGMQMADRLICIGHTTKSTKGQIKVWQTLLKNLPSGTNEIYCHPGYPDRTLKQYASYVNERKNELDVLLSNEFKLLIQSNQVELTDFYGI